VIGGGGGNGKLVPGSRLAKPAGRGNMGGPEDSD